MSKETREYAKQLVSQMTLEEKMSQMVYQSPAIERLGIPAYNWWNEATARRGKSWCGNGISAGYWPCSNV